LELIPSPLNDVAAVYFGDTLLAICFSFFGSLLGV
jgi:hypothetical protein